MTASARSEPSRFFLRSSSAGAIAGVFAKSIPVAGLHKSPSKAGPSTLEGKAGGSVVAAQDETG